MIATGTAKNDKIDGTSRNDVLDGGAGNDQLNAGSGNDTLIYTMAQNAGARDRYNGGSDTDTLRINFTAAEWAKAAVKADVAGYLAVLARAASGKGDDHGKEGKEGKEGTNDWFTFKSFGLEVRNVEKLLIYVNGVDLNVAQSFDYAENQVAGAVVGTVVATDAVGVTDFRFSANTSGTSADGFYSIGNDGKISITAAGVAAGVAQNDFETAPNSFTYGVQARDAVGNWSIVGTGVKLNEIQMVIDLAEYGKLIAPVQVDGGQWFYYWDRNGNNISDFGDSAIFADLDANIAWGDVDGAISEGSPTDVYRYATLNGVRVALPTVGDPRPDLPLDYSAPSTAVGSVPPAQGTNAENLSYDDYTAIWDAYNGTTVDEVELDGTPPLWSAHEPEIGGPTGHYLSASPGARGGGAAFNLSRGAAIALSDGLSFGSYVALRVL